MKNFEIKTIEHKGIRVSIMINYDTGLASLVEKQFPGNEMPYKSKQWLFKGRGLEYLDSWTRILEAMQVAVAECKVLLEKDIVEKNRLHDENIMRVADMSIEITKDTKPGDIKILNMKLKPIKKKRRYNLKK